MRFIWSLEVLQQDLLEQAKLKPPRWVQGSYLKCGLWLEWWLNNAFDPAGFGQSYGCAVCGLQLLWSAGFHGYGKVLQRVGQVSLHCPLSIVFITFFKHSIITELLKHDILCWTSLIYVLVQWHVTLTQFISFFHPCHIILLGPHHWFIPSLPLSLAPTVLVPGLALTSSTASTLRCCLSWLSRSPPFRRRSSKG